MKVLASWSPKIGCVKVENPVSLYPDSGSMIGCVWSPFVYPVMG